MPEGPEIRRAALRIGKVLNGKETRSVTFSQPHLQPVSYTHLTLPTTPYV